MSELLHRLNCWRTELPSLAFSLKDATVCCIATTAQPGSTKFLYLWQKCFSDTRFFKIEGVYDFNFPGDSPSFLQDRKMATYIISHNIHLNSVLLDMMLRKAPMALLCSLFRVLPPALEEFLQVLQRNWGYGLSYNMACEALWDWNWDQESYSLSHSLLWIPDGVLPAILDVM